MSTYPLASGAQYHNHENGIFIVGSDIRTSGGPVIISGRPSIPFSDDDALLQSMPYASGSEHSSDARQDQALCYAGTRVTLLRDIMAWASPDKPSADYPSCRYCVYWLDGMAGTGKSTIARTVARRLADKRQLGASFFFTRGGGDLSSARKFVTTVAVQLAAAVPTLKPHICCALRAAAPRVSGMALQDQWVRFVLEPLAAHRPARLLPRFGRSRVPPLVIVIDALDECDSENETAAIFGLLAVGVAAKASRLRVFLTSRPEWSIRYGMRSIPEPLRIHFVLHHIDTGIVDNDIAVYIADVLRPVGDDLMTGGDWPGAEAVKGLVKLAGGLFIWTSTVCRLIRTSGAFANNVLKEILRGANTTREPESSLDQIYLRVLQRSIDHEYRDDQKAQLISAMNAILGTVAVLAAPLDRAALSLISSTSTDAVNKALHSLHSILNVSQDARRPIRLHPASFRDFILDPARCDPNFFVDGKQQHLTVAERCLQLMSETLKQDICDVRDPGMPSLGIARSRVEQHLCPALRYSCCYWVHHLHGGGGGERLPLYGAVLAFLKEHFLHWLEALSVLERLSDALPMLRVLMVLEDEPDTGMKAFADDALKFVSAYFEVIERTPLQIYSSTLVFAPAISSVGRLFKHVVPAWIARQPEVKHDWGTMLRFFDEAAAVAFSSDGLLLAISRCREIKLWVPATLEPSGAISPMSTAHNLAFSPDCQLLAYSGIRKDGCPFVALYDTKLQVERGVVECYGYYEPFPTFSPDGLLATANRYHAVQFFDTDNATVRDVIDMGFDVSEVAFSADGQALACHLTKKFRIWDRQNRKVIVDVLQGGKVCSYGGAFAALGGFFAFAFNDKHVGVWNAGTKSLQRTISSDSAVEGLAFSPDCEVLVVWTSKMCSVFDVGSGSCRYSRHDVNSFFCRAVVSSDGRHFAGCFDRDSVGLWNLETGHLDAILEDTTHSQLTVFSPGGQLLMARHSNGGVGMYEVRRILRSTEVGDSPGVTAAAFSSDGQLLVSASEDGTLRVWGRDTDSWRSLPRGAAERVSNIKISPAGHVFATSSSAAVVQVWRIEDGELVATLQKPPFDTTVAFSTDGRYLAYDSMSLEARISEIGAATHVNLGYKGNTMLAAAFSPDGHYLATASGFHSSLWELRGLTRRRIILFTVASALAFSPDGGRLAVADRLGRLHVYDGQSSCYTLRLGFAKSIRQIAFSPDGRCLLTECRVYTAGRSDLDSTDEQAIAPPCLSLDDRWIRVADRNTLWLPPDYRPTVSAVHGNTIALGTRNGKTGDYLRPLKAARCRRSESTWLSSTLATRRRKRAAWYNWAATPNHRTLAT